MNRRTFSLHRGVALAFSLAMASIGLSGCDAPASKEKTDTADVTFSDRKPKVSDGFTLTPLAEGFVIPWGMAFLPDGRLLVTERPGRLQLLDLQRREVWPISGVPDVVADGQGGLLDVAVHPRFPEAPFIYLTYSSKPSILSRGPATHVGRGRLVDQRLVDFEVLVEALANGSESHYGSRLAFDQEHHLFVTVGERKDRAGVQQLDVLAGKILRLTDSGDAPADNPFVDQPNADPRVYTYGHRNPQGLFMDPPTQTLWSHEHGPRGGDEINRVLAGNNYGWAATSYGNEYAGGPVGQGPAVPGFVEPMYYFSPSIAPSGLVLYRGTRLPTLDGHLLSGALALRHLNAVPADVSVITDSPRERQLFKDLNLRIRDVEMAPDGTLLLATDSGTVYQVDAARSKQ